MNLFKKFEITNAQTVHSPCTSTAIDFRGSIVPELDLSVMALVLLCGVIGPIGLCLASRAKKVYGVELIEEAVKDANANARDNGVENALFCAGECNRDFPSMFVVKVMRDVCFL